VRLFPDYRAREQDYFRRTRIFPIMHLIVVRNDIYERHPFVAISLRGLLRRQGSRARENAVLRHAPPHSAKVAGRYRGTRRAFRRRLLAPRHRAEQTDA